MTVRDLLLTVALLSISLAGCVADEGPQRVQLLDRFEEDLAAWEQGSDVPDDPNREGETVNWSIGLSDEAATSGDRSVRMFIDGSQDDGTIWIVRPIDVAEAASYDATVRVQAWSQSESFNQITDLVLSLSTRPPTDEESFPRSQDGQPGESEDGKVAGIREPLHQTEGWQTYGFNWTTPEGVEQLYVAVGISVVWETEVHHFIDDLSVDLQPRATGGAEGGGTSTY